MVIDSALKYITSTYILERGEVVKSDHAAVGVNVEWNVRRKRKCRTKRKSKRKIMMTTRNWEFLGGKWKE